MLQNNYRYASKLQLAQEQAKNNRVNIWSENILDGNIESNIQTNEQNNIDMIGLAIIIIIFITIVAISLFKRKN